MSHWFISRHPGAKEWVEKQNIVIDYFIDHLESIELIQKDDHVYGTLPVNLAYAVCQKGAAYYHLALDIPQHYRGKELSADDMTNCSAQLTHYTIK